MIFLVHRMELTNQRGELASVVDRRMVVRLWEQIMPWCTARAPHRAPATT
jgi:hypothetical protein